MQKIPLTQGQFALVDDSDYEFLSQWKWFAKKDRSGDFYATRQCPGKTHLIYMHREILGLKYNDGQQGDHLNHNTLDNRQNNIRICTSQENQRNRKLSLNMSSIYKGVYWNKPRRKWRAYIRINKIAKHLGYFKIEKNAALAYDAMAIREFGEFAYLNFPAFQRSLVC